MTREPSGKSAKDGAYELLLQGANAVVDGWGEVPGAAPVRPTLFVVGVPRSGTTLLYQVLANSGAFQYPTNLIARFYRSPAWGARTQRLLAPLLHRGDMEYASRLGNTENWWGPHEFGYFWERHFDFSRHHEPGEPDLVPLVRALAAFESEGERPLMLKNPVLCFVLEFLARALPLSRFLWVRRPHIEVAASIHRTRVRFHGDPAPWWSLRPEDAPTEAPVAVQIAHQIGRAHGALTGLRDRYGDRVAEVGYADVCADPASAIRRATELVGAEWSGAPVPTVFEAAGAGVEPSIHRALEAALRERPELDPDDL